MKESPGQGESFRSAQLVNPPVNQDQTIVHQARHETDLESGRVLHYAYQVKSIAAKTSLDCEATLRGLTNSCARTELLCIANIKHRYGSRSSARLLKVFDAAMNYLYSTPRHQNKLTKQTKKLIKDWHHLLQQFKIVELLLNHLAGLADREYSRDVEELEAEASDEGDSTTSSEDGSRESVIRVFESPGDVWLYRTTKFLIEDAALRLEEISIQDQIMRRRAVALHAQWNLLLAQMKQLDQVDALDKKRAARLVDHVNNVKTNVR